MAHDGCAHARHSCCSFIQCSLSRLPAPVVGVEEPGSKSVPIKHTRPKVQKFDNGFIIEDTHMGPAQGKVGYKTLVLSK